MRGAWLVVVPVILVGLVLAAGRAPAAEEHPAPGGAETPAKAEGGHGGHGGPRDPFEQALDLTIWTSVVFLLLLFVLWLFAWKPILQALQTREQTIKDAIDEAQRARDDAHHLREQLQQEMNQAQEKVRELLDEARRDAQHATDDMIAKTRAEIQAERERLRREIELAKDQALLELRDFAANVGTLIAGKVVRRNLGDQDHRLLVDEALADLRRTGGDLRL